MNALREFLSGQQAGPISDTNTLERLLASCWHEFQGSRQTDMAGYKLHGRIENPTWHPPFLEFTIERHGAAALGSTRAPLHRWRLDIQAGTAEFAPGGRRQLRPMQKRLDVKPIAEKLVKLIILATKDERLKWAPDGNVVTVQMGKVLPDGSAVKQTLIERRRRLRRELEQRLAEHGWRKLGANKFTRDPVPER